MLASAVYALVMSAANWVQLDRMLYGDFDLAVHLQTLWALAHGSPLSSVLGVHFLANHFILVFYPLARLYALVPHPMLVLVLQTAALALGGWLSYLVARRFLSAPWALVMSLVYLLHPAVGHANLYEFHPTTLAVPALFGMILAYLGRRFVPFAGCALAAMCCQENLPLAVGAFTVWALLERRRPHWAVFPALAAGVWLVWVVGRIQPSLNQGVIEFWVIYGEYGSTPGQILAGMATRPWKVIGAFLTEPAALYLTQLGLPLLFLPLAALRWALPAAPFLLQHVLSSRTAERLITYHYSVEMMPFLVTATAAGAAKLLARIRTVSGRRALLIWMAAATLVSQMMASPFARAFRIVSESAPDAEDRFRRRLVRELDGGEPVVASFAFLPLLANRSELYSFHHVHQGAFTLSNLPYVLPETVRHAVLDLQEPLTYSFALTDPGERMERFIRSGPWEVVERMGDILWLRKAERSGIDELFKIEPALNGDRLEMVRSSVDGDIQLVGFKSTPLPRGPEGSSRSDFKLWWKCLRKTTTDYGVAFLLVDASGRVVWKTQHYLGYRFYPTSRWKPGQHVTETFRMVLPESLPDVPLELYLAPASSAVFRRFDPERAQRVDPDTGWVRLGKL